MAGSKMRFAVSSVAFGLAALVTSTALADPPGRVARLSFTTGAVSFRPASVDEWTTALINYPVTTGDHLWVDRGGKAEMQVGTTAVRVAPSSELSFLSLDDRNLQLRLTQGSVAARVRSLGEEESVEIDTPNGSIDLLRPGFYRVDVNEAGDQTTVIVRSGEAEATASGAAFTVRPESGVVLQGLDGTQMNPRAAGPTDAFEDWCLVRDRRMDQTNAVRYVSPAMIGYEDLDQYGTWRVVASYGSVWVPRTQAGWAPYRDGRWVWVDPWGWTWVDAAAWGFAPFHYGRWVYLPTGWAWVPGPIVARPVYAPALVAFVGGPTWHVSLSVNQPVAWFPLGPREPYIPAYHVTPEYVRAVNVTQVNVTNVSVTNITYVNRSVPGAVTAVSRETFVAARPVAAAAVVVPQAAVIQAPIVGHAAVVVPERTSVVVHESAAVVAPPVAVVSRQVVVRRTPPPAVVPFEARQAMLQQHPGVPLNDQERQTLHAQQPARVDQHPLVRPAAVAPPAPARVNNDLIARHAKERADLETRQSNERASALKRHEQLEMHAKTEQDRARIHQQNEKENQQIDARHKKEVDDMQKRHDAETKNAHPAPKGQ
jgi:hypothetical protein